MVLERILSLEAKTVGCFDEKISGGAGVIPLARGNLGEGECAAGGVDNSDPCTALGVGGIFDELPLEPVSPIVAHAEEAGSWSVARVGVATPDHGITADGTPELEIFNNFKFVTGVGKHRVTKLAIRRVGVIAPVT